MRLDVKISGLDAVTRDLVDRFSVRRLNAAAATALTRTALDIREAEKREMRLVFDRPTPYTLQSVRFRPATAENPVAEVFISQDRGPRDPSPAVVLKPQVQGGARGLKGLEVALRSAGQLPQGWLVMPGQGATLDAYGNVTRGLVTQVVAQLRAQRRETGPVNARKAAASVRKAGGRFFVVSPGTRRQPGIYLADAVGRNVVPVFVFVRSATYLKRLDFERVALTEARARLPRQVELAFSNAATRLAQR